MFARADLPMAARHVLMGMLSSLLADFAVDREWLARSRADQVVRDARDRGTVAIAALGPDPDTRPLVRHLRVSGQLTAGLVLRALLSGHVAMFEEVLAELSGLPLGRVQALVHGRGAAGFRAVYEKAGMPASVFPAFREAVTALREASERRRRVESAQAAGGRARACPVRARRYRRHRPLLILLRRYAAEAAREDARLIAKSSSPTSASGIAPRRERYMRRSSHFMTSTILSSLGSTIASSAPLRKNRWFFTCETFSPTRVGIG